ncbi:MAG: nucleoside-diphosphate kinase [Anaerolineales bacterium]|nr:nucleoside-diphosphate kinase [Anaerolineales bacterium]
MQAASPTRNPHKSTGRIALEKSLVIIKPDGVQRGLIGEIIGRLERRGLRLAAMKFMAVSSSLAAQHYAVHQGKPFYAGLLDYISSGPVVVMAWEGPKAIEAVRQTMGATNPTAAAPGTIRADLALDIGRNLIHASDGPETAAFELGLWFLPEDLVSWARDGERWVFE